MNDKISKQINKLSDQKSVVKFEFTNDSYIVLHKSGDEFWNATMSVVCSIIGLSCEKLQSLL